MTLLDKVWELHKVARLPNGQDQIFIALHLVHEVTSPQAFQMIQERGLPVLFPERTFATSDHIVPTDSKVRPFPDPLAEEMISTLERNVKKYGIASFFPGSGHQGIVHVIGPELGLTRPGITIACGDSHTSSHGAFGALGFGVGTTQIRDILATGTIALSKPKVRRIEVTGTLPKGVYAKDVIMTIIARLGVNGGLGYAYEYGGSAIRALGMEERLTICNMSIEGGARVGYIEPDEKTIEYLRNRPYAPKEFEAAARYWLSFRSDPGSSYDDYVEIEGNRLEPMVSWGINPGQAIPVSGSIPYPEELPPDERDTAEKAFRHMKFSPGEPIAGKKIDVAFIGSCTNGRIVDLREAARIVKGKKKALHVRAYVVPGSEQVARQAEQEGLDNIFRSAGFEWRSAGCSMCLAMNPDRLVGDEICASSSNRNFIGRQGSAKGRTLLMSPAMVAAAALAGEVVDLRQWDS
jgi:3-isopropylmalate/(R)-2-methylmalate dehydratase large subunit